MELCFNRIDKKLAMPKQNLHFPTGDLAAYSKSYDQVRCVVMQGGQGEVKHWAFNDPPRRKGKYKDDPPTAGGVPQARDARHRPAPDDGHPERPHVAAAGTSRACRRRRATVGPVETWKAERVSIWHAGNHDNPFGQRLTALMISKRIPDASVPMSLLADHPNVHFHYYRPGIGKVEAEMH